MPSNRIPRIGIGGPVGSGKTMLIETDCSNTFNKGIQSRHNF
jgi:Ni2+-binding GTPase involved in maturation of urease and hydrogenase